MLDLSLFVLPDLPRTDGQQTQARSAVHQASEDLGAQVARRGALGEFEGDGFGEDRGDAEGEPADAQGGGEGGEADDFGGDDGDGLIQKVVLVAVFSWRTVLGLEDWWMFGNMDGTYCPVCAQYCTAEKSVDDQDGIAFGWNPDG